MNAFNFDPVDVLLRQNSRKWSIYAYVREVDIDT